MARKTKSIQYVPLEERPEFIAAMAALPTDPAELEVRAERVLQLYHDAMLAADVQALDDAHLVHQACVVKLNGGTSRGCASVQDVLAAKFAAPAGQVPKWGQSGEFLLEVDGMRMVVKMGVGSLANHVGADLYAVDFDKPFISRTGYRHQFMRPAAHVGRTVDQAVRAEVMEASAREGWATTIDQEHGKPKDRKVWPWLADALAGVRPDGQLAMFGDAPKDPDAKAPMSNADRQKAFRLRQRELKEQQAAAGVKAITLTHTERCVLSLGLLAHEDLDHRPANWVTSKKPGFDALLAKLWPEGDNGRYLAEPKRSTYRPTAFLRDELERQRGMVQRLEALRRDVGHDFSALEVTDARLVPVWEKLPTDFSRAATALGMLRLRNNQHAELARAVEVLQGRLRAAGLNDQVSTDNKPWSWNESPLRDYRASSAPEFMERCSAGESDADLILALRREVAHLKEQRDETNTELMRSFETSRQLRKRLKEAGLSGE
ncbi:hypothetical protein LIS66_27325 (plasmid) [Pseudomonas sp. HN2]|uniref:hypothetical protein n=1 Tax=Pseudomonas sp. HN2 TaxID=2884805 RepID=UPI001D144CE9|nr:hypothetical protein [Pseudomonas sp. HN2]UEB98688.1 hypothetical protein LIS66_27620 [Pseudomonas sp. HN2]UEB98744.1 hypothetical protein LIS66_27325 [Pseudomonas sp. HN2]